MTDHEPADTSATARAGTGPRPAVRPARATATTTRGGIILRDAARLAAWPDEALFDARVWRDQGRVVRAAEGRGMACFVRVDTNETWVLRHYQRGGLVARFNHERYLWSGADATRPAREFRLLAALYNRGLPVPRPVAARAVRRAGMTYTADLITQAIPGTRPLADHLADVPMIEADWRNLGAVIARLHRTGVWHADLNARNVLVAEPSGFYLLDFDRARYRGDGTWRQANLKRFRRSLDKFVAHQPAFHFAEHDWGALLAGYEASFAGL